MDHTTRPTVEQLIADLIDVTALDDTEAAAMAGDLDAQHAVLRDLLRSATSDRDRSILLRLIGQVEAERVGRG